MGSPGKRVFRTTLSMLAAVVCLPGLAAAQSAAVGPAPAETASLEPKPWYTLGRVTTWVGSPLAGAEVAVYVEPNPDAAMKLQTDMHGEFEISMQEGPSAIRRVRVVARKQGYRDATEIAEAASVENSVRMDLVLRDLRDDNDEDPDLLSLRELTRGVTGSLLGFGEPSPEAAGRKETLEAAGSLLNAGDPDGALKALKKALNREPQSVEFRTLQALATLELGSWSGAARQLARTIALDSSLEPRSRRTEPYLILGVMESWRGNLPRAVELFHQALDADTPNPLLFEEVGRAELLNQSISEAEADLGRAIQLGAPPQAHLLRAAAFLAGGMVSEAQSEMRAYLGGRKPKELPITSRIYWMKLIGRLHLEQEARASGAKPVVKQTVDELLTAVPELQGLEPAKDQAELPAILQKTGERVESFFYDFRNTTSREDVREEQLRSTGKVKSFLNATYQYWLLGSSDYGRASLKEYRTAPEGKRQVKEASHEGLMLTEGFASVSHLLLPAYQKESDFVYLGRQREDGHDTQVLAFAQRPETSRLVGSFSDVEKNDWTLTLSQGIVWIDSETYQIVRLRTDLLYPIPKQHLDRMTTDIEYGEVHFNELARSVWLPHEVVVTVESRGKLRRNRHAYSGYRMFNVQSKILAVVDSSP
jgi:tetratricopeptide (TPR) repeat protein